MPLTYDGANLLNEHMMGRTALPIWTPYLSGSTTQPDRTRIGFAQPYNFTEPSGNGYASLNMTTGGSGGGHRLGVSALGVMSNTVVTALPLCTGSPWGTITHHGYKTGASGWGGGIILVGYRQLDQAIQVNPGGTLSFPIGTLNSIAA